MSERIPLGDLPRETVKDRREKAAALMMAMMQEQIRLRVENLRRSGQYMRGKGKDAEVVTVPAVIARACWLASLKS